MKRTTLLLAITALFTFAVASTADAHFLTFKRARNATLQLSSRECRQFQGCQGAAAGPAKRMSAHNVRVLGHFYGRNADGVAYDCHRVYAIQITRFSNQLYYKKSPLKCEPNSQHPVT